MAFYCYRTIVREILPRAGKAVNLPHKLVIPPGIYQVHGKTYALKREGLYRFLFPGRNDNQQRIVYRNNVMALLSAIAWLQTHGNRDKGKDFQKLKQQALTEKLILTCGSICDFACRLLAELGVPCRRVCVLTLQKFNGYDDSHALIEVRIQGRWVLVDLDMKRCFRYRGQRLSLIETVRQVRHNQYALESLSSSALFSVCCFKKSNQEGVYDYGLWMETMLHNPKCLRQWYRRILMAPIIDQYITVDKKSDRVALAKLRRCLPKRIFLERGAFIRKFYS